MVGNTVGGPFSSKDSELTMHHSGSTRDSSPHDNVMVAASCRQPWRSSVPAARPCQPERASSWPRHCPDPGYPVV